MRPVERGFTLVELVVMIVLASILSAFAMVKLLDRRAIDARGFADQMTAVLQFALVSDTASYRRLEKIAKDLRERLIRVPGVRATRVWALPTPEMRVALDTGRMAELGIPVTAVTDALKGGGQDLPPGAVQAGDARLEAMAGGAGSSIGRGGMITKILAAKRAARSGAHTVIASGHERDVLLRLLRGEAIGTLLTAATPTLAARKQWLADHLQVAGRLVLDSGAIKPGESTVLVLTGTGLKASEKIGELLKLKARVM